MKPLIAISDGHEMTTAGKRTPPIVELGGVVIKENEFNKAVALILEQDLKRCGFNTLNVSSTDNDTLQDRVTRANNAKADLFIAIHYNAYDGKFDDYDPEGVSVHICAVGGEAEKFANILLGELLKGTEQLNRGVRVSPFYVLKYTDMPAVLSENGYMDNKREALLMINDAFRREVAVEHAKAICKYYGVEYISNNDVGVMKSRIEFLEKKLKAVRDYLTDAIDYGV